MKLLTNSIAAILVAGGLGSSLIACGGSNQKAETAEAIDDADDAEEEVEDKREDEDLKAEEDAAEAREEHYDSVD